MVAQHATMTTPQRTASSLIETRIAKAIARPAMLVRPRHLRVKRLEPSRWLENHQSKTAMAPSIAEAIIASSEPKWMPANARTLGHAMLAAAASLERSTGPYSMRSAISSPEANSASTGPLLGSSSAPPLTAGNNHHPPPAISTRVQSRASRSTLRRCASTTLSG